MRVELSQSSFKPQHAHLILVNDGESASRVRKASVGFNPGGNIDEDVFEIWVGDRVPYRNANVLPHLDLGEHVLEPGVQLVSSVDLTRYYALPSAQLMIVRYAAAQPSGDRLVSDWVEFWFRS